MRHFTTSPYFSLLHKTLHSISLSANIIMFDGMFVLFLGKNAKKNVIIIIGTFIGSQSRDNKSSVFFLLGISILIAEKSIRKEEYRL